MCGIFAYIKKGEIEIEKIEKYFNKIKHRGPDSSDSILIKNGGYSIYLGFHRLAIIDTSKKSNKILEDEEIYMICNGEIYNYTYLIEKYGLKVKTGSDCEVIIQLYKKNKIEFHNKLEELDGVFSFVLYDKKSNNIYISRDRLGVRPLFEGNLKDELCYASEGKGILIDNVEAYKPGILKIIKLRDSIEIEEYKWKKENVYYNIEYNPAKSIIKTLLIEGVKKRLMSDRPIGFLLSGGLDSSLVASIAQKILCNQITTFSIGLEGSPDIIAARKVAEYLNSNHHEIIIKPEDIIDNIENVIYTDETYDITTIRASIPMYILSKYIREKTDIKVIFSGEGSDELFGGYLYFHKAPDTTEFQKETHRLLDELYKYDLLRGDRTTSAWGLEIRVPFLDAALYTFVSGLDPKHKIPTKNRIEKYILREAFEGYLPYDILYRQKEAFSDGVGYNSVNSIKNYAEKINIDNSMLNFIQNTAIPNTKEGYLYYYIFNKYYSDKYYIYPKYYWMPKWVENINDPSATMLTQHIKNNFIKDY